MTLGEKLQRLRKEQGWTQEELAARLNISRQAISKWESGASVPDTENVIQISRLFHVSTDSLLLDEWEYDEHVSPASHKEDTPPKKERRFFCMVAGSILSSVSAIGLLTLGILSSVFRCVIYGSPAEPLKTGFTAFLEVYHLRWLCTLCVIGILMGLLIAILPGLPSSENRTP